jgi:thiamine pyrophosphokinase
MNALLVCAGPSAGYEALVAEESDQADLVVAVDGGAGLCARAGVVPSVIIGDFDSISGADLAGAASAGVRCVRHPADKDMSDLDLALEYARSKGADCVTVCAAFAGRLDHTMVALGSLARADDLRPGFVEPGQRGWILSAEHRSTLEVEDEGATFSVLALLAEAVVSVQGAVWPLSMDRLAPMDAWGLSNRVGGPSARVQVHQGVVLVIRSGPASRSESAG